MPRIFLSHSSKDNRESAALNKWLTGQDPTLRRQVFLDIDRDVGMVGGEEWKDTIRRNLASCQALLILLSDNWDASKECYAEYDNAEAAGKKIYCARLQETAGLGRIAKYQRRELYGVGDEPTTTIDLDDGKPPVVFATDGLERLLLDISRRKRGADSFVWPPPGEPDRAPYRGWAPFEAQDAAVYFGRDAEVDNAVKLLEDVQEAARSKLFVILGPSGTGKSSFLRAGVLPRLALDGDRFIAMDVVRPGRDEAITGAMGLAASIRRLRTRLGLDAPSFGELKAQWIQDPIKVRQLLVECQELCSDEETAPALVLPLDQAEELFSSEAGPEAQALLGLARDLFAQSSTDSAGRQPLRLIIAATIRTDQYEEMQKAEQLDDVDTMLFNDLKPMRADRLSQVIEGPARRSTEGGYRLSVETPLLDQFLADATANSTVGSDTLPLLSGTLAQLYADYGDTGLLTLAQYEQLGGMSHVVQTKIDKILSVDPTERAAQLATLREAFIPYLATVSDDDEPLRRIALWRDLPPTSIDLVDKFVDARILTKDRRVLEGHTGEQEVVEIALESFLRQWDALAGWLRDEGEDLKAADELLRAASRWQASDRDPNYLHPAALLDKAEALAATATFGRKLEPTREFLVASRQLANDERDAKERTLRRNALRLRLVLAVAVVVALGAVAAFIWAFHSQTVARSNAQNATAQKLTAEAQSLLADVSGGNDNDLQAMQKLLAANKLADQPNEQPLLDALIKRFAMLKVLKVDQSVVGVAFAGHRLAMAQQSELDVWDTGTPGWQDTLGDPDRRRHLVGPDSTFTSVAVSADGRTVVAGTDSGWARQWDLGQPNPTAKPVLQQHQGRVTSVAVSADGRIASAGVDGIIALTGPAGDEGSAPPPIQLGEEVFSVAFSPTGDRLAVGGSNGAIHLFDVQGPNVVAGQVKPDAHRDGVMSVAFSPDGRTLLSGGADRMVRLWNAADITAPPLKEFQGHTATVTAVAFNAEGTKIASVSNDRTVRLWDVASGHQIGDPMKGHGGLVVAVAFVSDGDLIVSGGNEKTMRLWDGARGQPLSTPISSQTGPVTGVAISPDGVEIAAAGTDSEVRLWSADTGALIDHVKAHTGVATSVAFSPVERLVASAGADGTVALWRPGSGQPPRRFDGDRPLTSVAFSPNGDRIAAAGLDGQIVEWDLPSGHRTLLEKKDDAAVTAIAFAPNDDRLASVSVGGMLRMWRADHSQAWETKPAHALRGDVRNAEQVVDGYPDALGAVAFSPDGNRVATGGADWTVGGGAVGFVQLWNSADGADAGLSLKVGLGVMDIAFNPADDDGLVVASFDPYQVQLWNTRSPDGPMFRFPGHESQVVSVAVSRDGRRIVSGSADGSVRVWPNLPVGSASDAMCKKLTTPITDAEWQLWVSPNLPFQPTCTDHGASVSAKPK
jgi:WD40 repeat protein